MYVVSLQRSNALRFASNATGDADSIWGASANVQVTSWRDELSWSGTTCCPFKMMNKVTEVDASRVFVCDGVVHVIKLALWNTAFTATRSPNLRNQQRHKTNANTSPISSMQHFRLKGKEHGPNHSREKIRSIKHMLMRSARAMVDNTSDHDRLSADTGVAWATRTK